MKEILKGNLYLYWPYQFRSVFGKLGRKKCYGGLLILALAVILILSCTLVGYQQRNRSAYSFPPSITNGTGGSSYGDLLNSTPVEIRGFLKAKKKPHLVNVVGIDILYNISNIISDKRFLLAWSQMRTILSRSDALPETAQGVKEASIAWNDLISLMGNANTNSTGDSTTLENKDCPASVTALSYRVSSNGSYILDLPCGLIEDSSITLIGIPDEHNGSFQLELVGLETLGGSRPIVLHYRVSLPSNVTEEPVIIQNTWTNEFGWGKEEKCLTHSNNNSLTVDGLVLCNENVIRSIINVNSSANPPSALLSNSSRGSARTSANFPFVEGNLFTSTLWVGSEGFHMTVNGRHETSFAYREKLEPWLVSGVKMAGNLDVLSALAIDLPVAEGADMISDVESLKAPPLPRKRIVMLVGVFSASNNFERRMALRRSWMQYEAVRNGSVAVRFFIGLNTNIQVNIELWKEAQTYGDIQFMPFVDYYSLISMKSIAICIFGIKILPAKYIMKTDDDAFVRINEILARLKEKPPKGVLFGLISSVSEPNRDQNSKWYISSEEWPDETYPPWAHGPGYIITRDIAKFIVHGHQELDLMPFKLEDVAMGIWIEQFKSRGNEVNYINDESFFNAGCGENYVLAHYQSPRLVLCLWEKLQKEHKPVCCE